MRRSAMQAGLGLPTTNCLAHKMRKVSVRMYMMLLGHYILSCHIHVSCHLPLVSPPSLSASMTHPSRSHQQHRSPSDSVSLLRTAGALVMRRGLRAQRSENLKSEVNYCEHTILPFANCNSRSMSRGGIRKRHCFAFRVISCV